MVVLREPSQYAQWITFYESMLEWPEAQAVARFTCPRMVVFGSKAEGTVGGHQDKTPPEQFASDAKSSRS